VSVARWQEPTGLSGAASAPKEYFWTNGGDLLHSERNTDGSIAVMRDHLTLFNTLQRDDAPPVQIPKGALFLRPTPDGNGLLYGKPSALRGHSVDVRLLDANGANDRPLSVFWVTNVAWMPDGNQWIASRFDADYLNRLDGMPYRMLNTRSLSAWPPFVLGVNAQGHAISAGGSDQFEPSGPFQRGNSLHYPTAVLTEFDPAAPATHPKSWNVTMPPESVRGRLILSPSTDRILWIVEKQSSGLSSWLSRFQWGYNRPYSGDEALYVSQLNGTGMKQIFSAPTQRQRRGANVTIKVPLTDLQWLPDGKHISFVYEDSLYIAPVD
jgi:hypothetical protein